MFHYIMRIHRLRRYNVPNSNNNFIGSHTGTA